MFARNICPNNIRHEIARPEAEIFQAARGLAVEVAAVRRSIVLSCEMYPVVDRMNDSGTDRLLHRNLRFIEKSACERGPSAIVSPQ